MQLATLCYIKKNNQTLMLHRVKKKNDMHEGKWNGLGGKFEAGETPEECVIEAYVYSKDKKIVKTFASFSINKGSKEITFADTNVIPRACIKTMRRIYEKLK